MGPERLRKKQRQVLGERVSGRIGRHPHAAAEIASRVPGGPINGTLPVVPDACGRGAWSACGWGRKRPCELNSLKTGYFVKHYMLHVLLLMRATCCDKLPSVRRGGAGAPSRIPCCNHRFFQRDCRGGQGRLEVFGCCPHHRWSAVQEAMKPNQAKRGKR